MECLLWDPAAMLRGSPSCPWRGSCREEPTTSSISATCLSPLASGSSRLNPVVPGDATRSRDNLSLLSLAPLADLGAKQMLTVGISCSMWSGWICNNRWREQPARGVFVVVVSFFSVAYSQKSSSTEIKHLDLDSGCPGPNPVSSLARCDLGASCDISLHFNFLTCEMRRDKNSHFHLVAVRIEWDCSCKVSSVV